MPKKSKRSKSDNKNNSQKDVYPVLSLKEKEPPTSTSHSNAATSMKMEQIFNFTESHKKVTIGKDVQDYTKIRKDFVEDNNRKAFFESSVNVSNEEQKKETVNKKASTSGLSKSWAYNMSGQSWSDSPIMKKVLPTSRPKIAPLENVRVRLLPREDFLLSGEIPKVDNKILAQCNKCECVICPEGSKAHINDPEHCKMSSLNLATLKDLNSAKKNAKQRKSKKVSTPKALPPVPLFGDKQAVDPSGSGLISSIKVLVVTVNLNEQNNVKENENVVIDNSPSLLTKSLVEPVINQDSEPLETDRVLNIESPVLDKELEAPLMSELFQNVTPKKKSQKSKIYRKSKKPFNVMKIKEEIELEEILDLLEMPSEASTLLEQPEIKIKIKEEIVEDVDIKPACEQIIPATSSKTPLISTPQTPSDIIDSPAITFETFECPEKPKPSNIRLNAKVTFLPVTPAPTCYSSITPQSKVPNIQHNYNNTIYTSHPKPLLAVSMRAIRKIGSTYLLQNQRLEQQREEIDSLLNKRDNANNLNSPMSLFHHRPNILKNSARANISRINSNKRANSDKLAESPKRLRPNNDMNTFILHTDISDSIDSMVHSRPKELPNNYTACNTDYFR